jgi:flagellar biosynthetic protein FlhB
MAANDKTEKATPKKLDEARKKGQVARSVDLNGAAVLLASLLALSAFGPGMVDRMEEATVGSLAWAASPEVVNRKGLGELFATVGGHVLAASAPLVIACALASLAINFAQVGFKPSVGAIKPDVKKLNPMTGAKNLFGPNAAVETAKNLLKVSAVGGIVLLAVLPKMDEFAALGGEPAAALLPHVAKTILGIAQRAAAAYLVIAIIDLIYQRHRFGKKMRMDKQEVKDEFKQQELPGEVKGQQRRRAMEMSRARMMDAVPTADVVVTNPTHFSVALRYDVETSAPIVVAKGVDHLAFKIREIAAEHGVAVVPDPPLARTLYATVDVGRMIPEELYHGVAQLLAYVYSVAGRRAAA